MSQAHAPERECDEPHWLLAAAARSPERVAWITPEERLSFGELEQRVRELAGQLRAAGLEIGAPLAVQSADPSEVVLALHAASGLHSPLVLLHPRLTPAEVRPLLERAEPGLVAHSGAQTATIEASLTGSRAGPRAPRVAFESLRELAPQPTEFASSLDPGADLTILFTSGTTGTPKGVRSTLAQHRASARANQRWLGLSSRDRWLMCMPPFHIGGLAIALRCARLSSTLVVHARFEPERVLETLERESITHVSLVPTMLARLLECAPARPAPPGLRCVLLGGGPIAAETAERALDLGWPLAATYGLTEAASSVATGRPGQRELGWLPPLPETELRVVDADGKQLPPGTPGEIWVRGPQVMQGYLREPQATARTLVDGWLRTGDVGELDRAGRLRVLDRRDDLIVSGGENIYPAEIEAVLSLHPLVREAAVVGMPDAHWGQRGVAIVVRAPEPPGLGRSTERADPDAGLARELRRHCEARLASFKCPREFVFRERPLPRTASGKLRRSELRAQVTP